MANDDQEKQDEATKYQQAMFLRYQPQKGRADKLAANIPDYKKEKDY